MRSVGGTLLWSTCLLRKCMEREPCVWKLQKKPIFAINMTMFDTELHLAHFSSGDGGADPKLCFRYKAVWSIHTACRAGGRWLSCTGVAGEKLVPWLSTRDLVISVLQGLHF